MRKPAKHYLQRLVPTILLILGIAAALWWFIRNNSTRIARQNEEYISELTVQRADSIDKLIDENLDFIRSTAYLYGRSLTSPWADVSVIREYEENSVFDMLRFVDASGDNYTSRGVQSNLADREYFQAGMRGESGVAYVLASRVTGERQIGVYAPVYYDGGIIGVMVGFYGEDYIRQLLEYELFGYYGEGWLCTRDGVVLGSTLEEGHDNFFTYMRESGRCAGEELDRLAAAMAAGEDAAFTWREDGMDATGYAVCLSETDWVLIRSFPPSASAQILRDANGEGERLILILVVLFAVYTAVIALRTLWERNRMREANRNANDVSTGVSRLFLDFMTIDLRTGQYAYMGELPPNSELPPQGDYELFCRQLLRNIPTEEERAEAAEWIGAERLGAQLADTDRVSRRIHAPLADSGDWFTFNFIVIQRDGSVPARLLLACQDVTELHRREEEEQRRLQEALTAAEKASRAKTEFLFNMSHDLRTPMNAIIGYTELAGRPGVTDEEKSEFIRKIDASGHHLLALINDILEMSRIESGKMTLEPEPTDLTQVIREAQEMFATQMAGKSITFTADASGVADRWVSCDRNRLNRVLLNLLSNAYKFTGEGGRIDLTLHQTGAEEGCGLYELRVRDTGIGMSPEFAAKLFTPFERERTSTVSGIQGTGLGLSITKSIVDMMGGSIDVDTEPGRGTEFLVRLRFPLTEDGPARDESAAVRPETLDFSGVRLLLAEDNMINREIATLLLTQAGFQLETAENGRIAVDMLAASEPGYYDLILMDIQMPEMDGYAATKAIRALENQTLARIPIIAMTANAFQEDIQAARDAGMDGHIAKPLDVDKMLATLAEVLAARRAEA